MLYSEWLRKVADIIKHAEGTGHTLYLCHALSGDGREQWHTGSEAARLGMEVAGLFAYDAHLDTLRGQIKDVVRYQQELVDAGVIPHPSDDHGMSPWLEYVGKSRSHWLYDLAIQANPISKAYKPTHGGYPDASRNLSSHRCSRDDGVSGD